MNRRPLVFLAGAILLVLALVLLSGRREPSYEGKALSYYVLKAAQDNWTNGSPPQYILSPQTRAAFLAIGTNGLPLYLEWLPYEPKGLKKVQMYIADTSRKWVKHRWFANYKPMARSFGSAIALNLLGERAESAIPTLVAYITNNTISSTSHGQAVAFGCLASVGKPALPELLKLMTNSSPSIRAHAIYHSLQLSTNSAVLERVKERLQDPDASVRNQAALGLLRLGQYGGSVRRLQK